MALVAYSPGEMVYQMAEAAVFGTAIADDQVAVELSCGILTFNPDNKLVRPDRYRGQNWPDVFDLSNNTDGSLPTVSGEMPVLKTEIADFLYMMIQAGAESDTTPYQKTFAYVAPSPDFTVNAGYFMTFWGKAPVASVSETIGTVIGQKLELTLSPDANDGNLHMNFTGLGIDYSRVSNPTGELTKSVQTRFSFFDIANCKLDTTDVILQELKLTLENEIIPVGFDGSGNIQTFALKPMVTAEVKGIWDAGMRAQQGKFDSGAETFLTIDWGATGVDGFLSFILHGVIDDGNHAEDSVRGVNVTISGASDLTNTEAMLVAEIADATDRTW